MRKSRGGGGFARLGVVREGEGEGDRLPSGLWMLEGEEEEEGRAEFVELRI